MLIVAVVANVIVVIDGHVLRFTTTTTTTITTIITMTTLFQQPCLFSAGAANLESLPVAAYPEVAFAGRSNVGKSSLLNALTGRKALARTSQNPGATKQLNFFLLAGTLMLVDMPGYGFAKVSKAQKDAWDGLIKTYLSGRPNLRRVCLLIDARRGILPPDEEHMNLLDEAAVSYQIVLTKADSLRPKELESALAGVEKTIAAHAAAHPYILATSAKTKRGMGALQEQLAPFAKAL